PVLLLAVVLGYRGRTRRERDPRLLGGREDVDVRREAIRLFQGADANEANRVARARVVAPHGDAAPRAAGDPLSLAAVRRRVDDLWRALDEQDAVSLHESVQRERRARLTLTPPAVAAVHHEGSPDHAVTHGAARAAARVGFVFAGRHLRR